MARSCCLAGIDSGDVELLRAALHTSGAVTRAAIAPLDVTELGTRDPELILCDVDGLAVDPLEMLRRLRFVLPDCIIAVYTGVITREQARACHLAGANCLLSKDSTVQELALGLRGALSSGCFTDPRFTVAYGSARHV